MTAGSALLRHSCRRTRLFLLSAAALLTAFQVLLVFAARSLQELNTFSALAALVPDFLRQVFGSSLLTLMSFRGVICLGYVHVAILAFLIGLVISEASEPAVEMETHFLDILLSHAMARHWIVTRTVALMAASLLFLLGAMTLGTWIGLHWLVAWDLAHETFAVVPGIVVNLWLLLFCWGGVALAISSMIRRRSLATGATAFLAFACYMTDLISQVWKPLKPVARYTPFHYYNPLFLITGSPGANSDLLVLACGAAAFIAFAYLYFRSRDL